MLIELWSDVVCPWCYVGKRRLERALADSEHAADVTVVHRAFQLDPAAPRGATRSRRAMLMAKYRLTAPQVHEMDVRMAETMAAEGLEYRIQDGVTGHTADAHRLLHAARDRGQQAALLDRFYRAYFAEGRSLFDCASLAALAAEAGLDAGDADRVLQSDAYADAVQRDQDAARALGVAGVPFAVFAGRLAVSGAQPVEIFQQALAQAARRPATA